MQHCRDPQSLIPPASAPLLHPLGTGPAEHRPKWPPSQDPGSYQRIGFRGHRMGCEVCRFQVICAPRGRGLRFCTYRRGVFVRCGTPWRPALREIGTDPLRSVLKFTLRGVGSRRNVTRAIDRSPGTRGPLEVALLCVRGRTVPSISGAYSPLMILAARCYGNAGHTGQSP